LLDGFDRAGIGGDLGVEQVLPGNPRPPPDGPGCQRRTHCGQSRMLTQGMPWLPAAA